MNSYSGKERTSLGMIFQLQLAEDNPVRLLWGITLNKTRERRPYSVGGKLLESTGDKLQDLLEENGFQISWEFPVKGYQDIQPHLLTYQ